MEHETSNDLYGNQTQIKPDWPNETVISFLNEIKELPVLWDYNHPQYKDNVAKREAWNHLCTKFSSAEEELKRKWMSLQASYRRERSKEFENARRASTWFAYSATSFLGDRYRPRREKFTIQIIDDNIKHDETVDYTDESNIGTEDVFAGIITDVRVVTDEDSESIGKQEDMETDTVMKSTMRSSKVKREKFSYDDSNSNMNQSDDAQQQSPKENNNNNNNNNNQRDECVVFGEYVVTKLRKLDSHSRAVAQHYINQTLFEAELGRYKQSFLTEHE